MIIKEFEALLHLFAIFNFIYTISPEFIKFINENISRAYSNVKIRLASVAGDLHVIRESLATQPNIKTSDIDCTERLTRVKSQTKEFTAQFKRLKRTILHRIDTAQFAITFKHICLYGGLFCITILFVNGYHNQVDHERYNNAMFLFDTGALLFGIYCFIHERNLIPVKGTTFAGTIVIFLIILTLSVGYYFAFSPKHSWFGGLTLTTYTILAASLHFLIYAAMTMVMAITNSRIMISEITPLSNQVNELKNGDYTKLMHFFEVYSEVELIDTEKANSTTITVVIEGTANQGQSEDSTENKA